MCLVNLMSRLNNDGSIESLREIIYFLLQLHLFNS